MQITRRTAVQSAAAALIPHGALATTPKIAEEKSVSPLQKIRHLDYTVIFARDMDAMRRFYAEVMEFPVYNELGRGWIAYRVGASLLALTERGMMWNDPAPPAGALSLQLAFRVAPGEVDDCAVVLAARGVTIVAPPTDQPWGHRTLFFRDPDGNVLEIYADI